GVCVATCSDGIKDGDETDTDCGGKTCPGCAVMKTCKVGGDCASGVCQGGTCKDNYVWAEQFGDPQSQEGTAVAVDSLGNTFLLSQISGNVDFGGGALVTPGFSAIAAAKFNPMGQYQWAKVFNSGAGSIASGAAVDSAGQISFTGLAST